MTDEQQEWHKVAESGDLPEGRVMTVTVRRRSLALTHYQGRYGCLDNSCPHQGGPLGEGSIEQGWLRWPWHGYDYNPLDGRPPEGFDDATQCFWQTGLHNPDFAAFAELCGAAGTRVSDPELLEGAVGAAVDHPGPALVEVMTDPLLV
jgi:nitrite reductase/ring-hydroxylating ferredoxin subunit